VSGLAQFLSLGAPPASAADRPAKATQMHDIVATINAAPGCDAAMKNFRGLKIRRGGREEI
jgi:hypothetical protein